MTISKKGLWVIILFLLVLLLGQSYICRDKIIETGAYYKNKIVKLCQDYKNQKTARKALGKFISADIKPNSVIIFEPNKYHHECMPGYAKYFTDLGYNVDVLILPGCEDALDSFEPKDKLRIFNFDNLDQMTFISSDLSDKFLKYDYALLHTTDPNKKDLIEKLGFFSNPKSLFIAHDTEFIDAMGYADFYNQNRILTLGDFKKGLYVNPHYFGTFDDHMKNQKTRFFITSTSGRNYDGLIESVQNLKNSGLDFEIMVVGRSDTLTREKIPSDLVNYFIFKRGIPYKQMYAEVQNSDYILMLLEPQNEYDNVFRTLRVTGTAQLVYGFSKPPIIQEDFAEFYKFNSKNAFIYGKNKTLTHIMSEAIKTSAKEYSKKSAQTTLLAKEIYDTSLSNLKKALKI